MMTKFLVLLFLALIACFPQQTRAQTTAFTYQGSLKDEANPANGNYDFEFALFDALSGGAQTGLTLTRSSVAVANGIFAVSLDFGSQFPGAGRFLDIRVRQSGGGAFTPLAPRQQINSAPYSVKSKNTDDAAQLGGVAANQYVLTTDPRMSDARPPTAGSANYIRNQNAALQSGQFYISGTGTAGIMNATTQFNLQYQRFVSSPSNFSTFVGTFAGESTTGVQNSFFGYEAGRRTTTADSNSFFGTRSGGSNTRGVGNTAVGSDSGYFNTTGSQNSFFGISSGTLNSTGYYNTAIGSFANFGAGDLTNATAIGSMALVSQSDSLVLGSINGVHGAQATVNVGIGTTAPQQRLHVVGNGLFTGNLTASGDTTVAGTLSGNILNAVTQLNINGLRMFTANGPLLDVRNSMATNTFAGERAGLNTVPNSTPDSIMGKANSFFGSLSGESNTAGYFNSFFGSFSGRLSTTAAYNSFFGSISGESNTTGNDNSFFGFGSGASNTTGRDNSFFGSSAGEYNTTGFLNTFAGRSSGVENTTGNANAFFGVGSGQSNETGSWNSFFGPSSGALNTTGSYNVAIGANAKFGSPDLQYATAIGAKAVVNSSNTIELGRPGGEDQVRIPGALGVTGNLSIASLGVAGSTPLCQNASNQIATCSSSAVKEQQAQIEAQQKQIAALTLALCSVKPDLVMCKTKF